MHAAIRLSTQWSILILMGLFTTATSRPCRADAPAVEGTVVDVFGKKMTVPAAFKTAPKKSRIIAHEFAASGEGDETARVTMMAAGGGVQPNLDRWKGQFSGDDKEVGDVETWNVAGFEIHMMDVSGNYAETMGGGPFSGGKKVMRKDYAMRGAIIVDPRGPSYFVKMIGPGEIVKANQDAFKTMINSLSE